MPAVIVLGDKTDHGGEVIEASGVTDTHGRRIARVGDRVQCPKKGHGSTVIVEGDMTFVIDGKAVAYHGCKTSCGAVLISTQAVTTVDMGGGGAGKASATNASAAVAAGATQQQSTLKFFFDEQPQLGSVAAGLPWVIKTRDGHILSGVAGEDGLLPRVDSLNAEDYSVYWGDEALALMLDAGEPS
jgi:uncharacterized Zn-binding protein involved in type VI secretion